MSFRSGKFHVSAQSRPPQKIILSSPFLFPLSSEISFSRNISQRGSRHTRVPSSAIDFFYANFLCAKTVVGFAGQKKIDVFATMAKIRVLARVSLLPLVYSASWLFISAQSAFVALWPSIAENGAGNAINAPRGSTVFSLATPFISRSRSIIERTLFDMYLPIPFSNYISRIESVAQHIHCCLQFLIFNVAARSSLYWYRVWQKTIVKH